MKRRLALLLCLVMALSLIPAAAAEEIEIIDPEDEPITVVDPEDAAEPEATSPAAEPMGVVAINATNLPDDTFRSYVSEECDTNGDGVPSASEIADVIYIECVFRGIESLEGIEFFCADRFELQLLSAAVVGCVEQ